MDWLKMAQEAGVAMTLVIAGIVILLLLIKWILEQFKTELTENRKERGEFLQALAGIKLEMAQHSLCVNEFHGHAIAEHKEMIMALGRINGYKS